VVVVAAVIEVDVAVAAVVDTTVSRHAVSA